MISHYYNNTSINKKIILKGNQNPLITDDNDLIKNL